MAFVKAKRFDVYIKALLSGPSGSGKTNGAVELATGLYNKCGGTGIAFIGTEGDRDVLYAGQKSKHGDYRYDYDILQLSDPFTTDKFIAAINEAIDAGYKVIIIDSLSAEWKWLNDTHDKMPGNSFTNWGKLKPKHRAMLDRILSAPAHIICCARGKDEWLLEERNGKSVPKKVGIGSQQDKDLSYEMMLSLQLDQDTHLAHADKDNTNLWPETRYSVITSKDGEALYDWCQVGEPAPPKPPVIQKAEATSVTADGDDLKAIKVEIVKLCTALGGRGNNELMDTLKTYADNGNPMLIYSLDKANELLGKLEAMKEVQDKLKAMKELQNKNNNNSEGE